MVGIRARLRAFKARRAQMNLVKYGMWFLLGAALLMMIFLYFALTKSV